MEGDEVTESLNEWEQIQCSTTQSREWEMVVVRDNNKSKNNYRHHGQDDLSIFPPSKHEGLQIPPPDSKTTPSEPSSSVVCDVKGEDRVGSDSISRPKYMRNEIGNVLRSGISRIKGRVGCFLICRKGFCSFASVTTLLIAAVFLYSKLQRWRRPCLRWELERNNRLILLLKEKDETISQLLLQIAQMNEMLAARRKVPVIRVG